MDQKIIVLAGATGRLGQLIARELAQSAEVRLRALVRPGSRAKAADLDRLGAEIIEIDLAAETAPAQLRSVMSGADAVVSTLQGGPEVIVAAQLRLLAAAAEAGVARFFPSDFSMNMADLEPGAVPGIDLRKAFAAQAQTIRGSVQLIRVQCGCFIDTAVLFGFLGVVDLIRNEIDLWGEGDAAMNFTTFEDTARFTAAAVLDPAPLPDVLNVAGETLTFAELVQACEAGLGRSLRVVRRGSLSDLDARIAERQKAAPQDIRAYVPMMYWRGMLNGKGRMARLDNARYALGPMTGIADYLRQTAL